MKCGGSAYSRNFHRPNRRACKSPQGENMSQASEVNIRPARVSNGLHPFASHYFKTPRGRIHDEWAGHPECDTDDCFIESLSTSNGWIKWVFSGSHALRSSLYTSPADPKTPSFRHGCRNPEPWTVTCRLHKCLIQVSCQPLGSHPCDWIPAVHAGMTGLLHLCITTSAGAWGTKKHF